MVHERIARVHASPSAQLSWREECIRCAIVLFASLSGGALLGATLLFPECHPLAWIGLVPFAYLLSPRLGAGLAYGGGFLGATAINAVGTAWMCRGFNGFFSGVWFFSSLCAGGVFALPLALGRGWVNARPWPTAVVMPVVWVSYEYLREWLWLAFDGSGLPLLSLGLPLANSAHFCQIADLGGVFAMSWLIAGVNGGIVDLFRGLFVRSPVRRDAIAVGPGIALLFLCGSWLYGAWRLAQPLENPGPTIALVTGELSTIAGLAAVRRVEGSITQRSFVATSPASTAPVDLFAWSEAALPGVFRLGNNQESRDGRKSDGGVLESDGRRLAAIADGIGRPIVTGVLRRERDSPTHERYYNSAAYVLPGEGLRGLYDKWHRMPFIEFTPWWLKVIGFSAADLLPLPRIAESNVDRGTRTDVFLLKARQTGRSYRIGATVCYDVCFPDVHRQYMNHNADSAPDLFLCLMNESFDRDGVLPRLTLLHTRLRAIECRRPYFRVSQDGASAIIDSCGRVRHQAVWGTLGNVAVVGRVAGDLRRSAYAAWGNWLPLVCCVFLVGGCIPLWRPRPCLPPRRG